jgi:hypothetical protein
MFNFTVFFRLRNSRNSQCSGFVLVVTSTECIYSRVTDKPMPVARASIICECARRRRGRTILQRFGFWLSKQLEEFSMFRFCWLMLIRPQSVGLISDKPITSTNYLRVCENAAWPYSSTAKLHASLSFHGGAHLVLNAQGQARQPHSRVQALDSVACLAARSSHTPQNIAIRWSREEERAWTRQVVDPSSSLLLGLGG